VAITIWSSRMGYEQVEVQLAIVQFDLTVNDELQFKLRYELIEKSWFRWYSNGANNDDVLEISVITGAKQPTNDKKMLYSFASVRNLLWFVDNADVIIGVGVSVVTVISKKDIFQSFIFILQLGEIHTAWVIS